MMVIIMIMIAVLLILDDVTHVKAIIDNPKKAKVGDRICTNGYVMDYFCIKRGMLFDNPTIATLGPDGPSSHSVHCLIDVPICVNSPFEIVHEISDGDGEERYGRAWRVTNNKKIVDHAKKVGACDDGCNGEQEKGLRITIIGEIVNLGDFETPALIQPLKVGHGDIGCGKWTFEVPNMILE
jgi:hypothetical protein